MGPLAEEKVKYLAQRLLHTIDFLHKHDIVHGNICSDNIIIESNDNNKLDFKLIDFGAADFARVDIVFDKNLHKIKAFSPPEFCYG